MLVLVRPAAAAIYPHDLPGQISSAHQVEVGLGSLPYRSTGGSGKLTVKLVIAASPMA